MDESICTSCACEILGGWKCPYHSQIDGMGAEEMLEATRLLERWGEARATEKTARDAAHLASCESRADPYNVLLRSAWDQKGLDLQHAHDATSRAFSDVCALADRLAKRKSHAE